MADPLLFCWSGGKDSTLALHEILKSGSHEVVALMTTVTETFDRISMHGVRRQLLEEQAASLGLPLEVVTITDKADNEQYERNMGRVLALYKEQGVRHVGFGDIFLEDLRRYRDRTLAYVEMVGVYPIWKRDTRELISEFVRHGYQAYLCCIDTGVLPESFAGRLIDDNFIRDLPSGVDPCGENGEYHSFVFDGPIFKKPLKLRPGEIRISDRFCFRDLIPEKEPIHV